ncbi:MAG TPA: hypothetical protein EYP14_16015, partial [Planctomycetaceae bacterium]|nr:hypothetical protein [Planctomycetaceae bacterium]
GGNILIGATQPYSGGPGVVYLFDGSTGELLRTFHNPSPDAGDRFGASIAAVGDNVLIGAYYDDTAGTDAGAAYLFDGSGTLVRTFYGEAPGDWFGHQVAFAGNAVLVGAPKNDTGASDAGAAYLFHGSTGELLHRFLNPSPDAGDIFGRSVAGVGNNALIGAYRDDTGGENCGAAYLFDGSTGELLHAFHNPTPAPKDRFGANVAAAGPNVLIAATGDDAGAEDAGAVYLFDASSGRLLQTFLNPSPDGYDHFGSGVAAVGSKILVGAYRDDMGAANAGAAYLFWGPGEGSGAHVVAVGAGTTVEAVDFGNARAAGIRITETAGSTEVAEDGATDTYEVVLLSAPKAEVRITVAGDGQVSVEPSTLTFTKDNWEHPQTVTVRAV